VAGGGIIDFSDFPHYPAGIARCEHVFRNVPSDNASCADHGSRANTDAGQDDCSTTNPYVGSDFYGLTELFFSSLCGVPRVHRRQYLYRWAQEREVTNLNATYIQDHTVEVEENALAEFDVTT